MLRKIFSCLQENVTHRRRTIGSSSGSPITGHFGSFTHSLCILIFFVNMWLCQKIYIHDEKDKDKSVIIKLIDIFVKRVFYSQKNMHIVPFPHSWNIVQKTGNSNFFDCTSVVEMLLNFFESGISYLFDALSDALDESPRDQTVPLWTITKPNTIFLITYTDEDVECSGCPDEAFEYNSVTDALDAFDENNTKNKLLVDREGYDYFCMTMGGRLVEGAYPIILKNKGIVTPVTSNVFGELLHPFEEFDTSSDESYVRIESPIERSDVVVESNKHTTAKFSEKAR